jgi:hypothetical protein
MPRNRITVKRVREAYARKPFYPISGVFRDGQAGRCPISAVASAERRSVSYYALSGVKDGSDYLRRLSERLGISEQYLKSFVDGYDGIHDFDPGRHTKTGYGDGSRVRAHIPPEVDYVEG